VGVRDGGLRAVVAAVSTAGAPSGAPGSIVVREIP
jgi:hypothetical protein